MEAGQACIRFSLRAGTNYGNRAYFPAHTADALPEQIMEAFLGQFYANKIPPKLILLSTNVMEKRVLTDALSDRAERRVNLRVLSRGQKRGLVRLALENARKALNRRLVESASQRQLLDGLAEKLGLDHAPERIEVYDNSHISGTNAIGAMIVSGPEGFIKNAYRKFNIRSDTEDTEFQPGDDYAMMREVLTRRFARVQRKILTNPADNGPIWC